MLSRGLYDPIAFWPVAAWPLIFSSCLYAIVRLCQMARQGYGVDALDAARAPDAVVLYLFFPAAAVFEVAVHGYLLWTIGYFYAVLAIPIYICGWLLMPFLLDSFRPAQYLLPLMYLLFAAAFVVLLGFADIGLLRVLNSELYALMTGLPAQL